MRVVIGLLVMATVIACGMARWAGARDAPAAGPAVQLPEFTHGAAADWINSGPQSAASLRGRPVLVEVWTFDCSNCLASLPWMQRVARRYGSQGLAIVAVHTPELPEERDRAGVRRAISRLAIGYPVMVDDDYSYWRALDNRYWPAFYLFDAQGRRLAMEVGELHSGEARADALEQRIAALLPAATVRAAP
jgi:thiol-disulfide isomerase/thioredoxin